MKISSFLFFILTSILMPAQVKLRALADTVGFAHTQQQMDAVMQRIEKEQGEKLKSIRSEKNISEKENWRLAIAPHDDYTYVGYLYPLALQNIKAKTIIIFGVAHKAAQLKLEDQLIFDSFTHWRGPYGNVKVSALREEIMKGLPIAIFQVNDSMQTIEHSVEAEIPFLQYFNRNVEIISILVPYMSYERMNELAKPLAASIAKVMQEKKLQWGKDVALLVSTDAVHYGDENWNGKNFAFFGADTNGYNKAIIYEKELINDCFDDEMTKEKIKLFTQITVKKEDHKEYKWTWCGRYSVPLGMLTAFYLQDDLHAEKLKGIPLAYANSLDHAHIKVDDLGGMGTTAVANIHHWVGYASIGFR